ncbi:uncharacterized protein LOC141655262 [Silene latifolia]|uniref:uncharacterized protein LOC141655262 n=1 Tax=Silene latifolia TaxID=37657 RepID=UPI003D773E14
MTLTNVEEERSYWYTCVYGFNDQNMRRELWDNLKSYSDNCNDAWAIGGDFNNVLSFQKRIGDIKAIGSYFTWNNKQGVGTRRYSRLDRLLVNEEWLRIFPEAFANFLPEGIFDHCPCVVQFGVATQRKKSPFKYYNMWSLFPGFTQLVWDHREEQVDCTLMYQLVSKLKNLKGPLKGINKKNFNDIENTTSITLMALTQIRKSLRDNPLDPNLILTEREMSKEYATLLNAKHQFLVQKLKLNGLLKVMTILPISMLVRAFENFFIQILGTSQEVNRVHKPTVQKGRVVTADQKEKLLKRVTAEEIRLAMFSISETKAPGPDGYINQFFKDSWNITGPAVCDAIMDFFEHGELLKQVNNTVLTLVPKGRKACSPRLLMKIDLQKAYDSIEWSFVKEMLEALQFSEKFIQLIMECVTTPSFSLALNDDFFGFFKAKRGIRQDDLLLFCKGERTSVTILLRGFETFSCASGLKMNRGKSCLYGNGITSEDFKELIHLAGIPAGKLPFRYLGVPIIAKRLTSFDRSKLVERGVDRIRALGARKLSYAGRLDTCCKSKKEGGIGILDLRRWNTAAMDKYIWWIAQKEDHLWVKWIHAIYMKNGSWSDYLPKFGASWSWRKLCAVKEKMKAGYCGDWWMKQGGIYTIEDGYKWLGAPASKVEWTPFVWNNLSLPKHYFIGWLVADGRLLTRDRLHKMKMCEDTWWLKHRMRNLLRKKVIAAGHQNSSAEFAKQKKDQWNV